MKQYMIKWAMVALAVVACYFVYSFSATILPWYAALATASALAATYIGLAIADIPPSRQRYALYIATAAMVVETTYGILFTLSEMRPQVFDNMDLTGDIMLAILHGGAFSPLLFLVTLFVFHQQGEVAADPTAELMQQVIEQQAQTNAALLHQMQAMASQSHAAAETIRLQLPFVCPKCNGRFATPNLLQKHYKDVPQCHPQYQAQETAAQSQMEG